MYKVLEVSDEGCVHNINVKSDLKRFTYSDFNLYIRQHNDFPPYPLTFELKMYRDKAHSKLNDFLFGSSNGYIVSTKVKEILDTLNLPYHRFYPATVVKNRKEYQYYYLFCFSDALSLLEFSQSKLGFINELNKEVSFTVESYSEFEEFKESKIKLKNSDNGLKDEFGLPKIGSMKATMELRKELVWLYKANELVFGKDFDKNIDLFHVSHFSWMKYISSRLADALTNANVTGVIISEINERQYIVERHNPEIKWL
jgi:hypothetical protein